MPDEPKGPPPDNPSGLQPLHFTVTQTTKLFRIYTKTYSPAPDTFRFNGPRLRFDHHPEGDPADHPDRGILYAAFDLVTCLAEVFGDTCVVEVQDRFLAVCYPTRPLTLLDLQDYAQRAGTIAAIAQHRHALAQAWSRYFYDHPEIYGKIDGLIYRGAHNNGTCVALYERAAGALSCPAADVLPLGHPQILGVINNHEKLKGYAVEGL